MVARQAGMQWSVILGGIGLVALIAGTFVAVAPPVDDPTGEIVEHLVDRRAAVLIGALLTITAAALLLAPLAELMARLRSDGHEGAGTFAFGAWILAFGFLTMSAVSRATVAWAHADELAPDTVRLATDLSHLALWGLSAPVAIVAVVAATVPAYRAGLVGPVVAALAGLKVATAAVEVVGTWSTSGWNAGGYAASTSGVATVLWFAALVVALSRATPDRVEATRRAREWGAPESGPLGRSAGAAD